MSINQSQDEIIEEFSAFDDWMDRYSLLIDLGNSLEPFNEADKTDANLIDGCQSNVWFTAELADRTNAAGVTEHVIIYHGDSDAILVKGMVALLIRVLSGHTPQDIVGADLYFIEAIGLREHLSPTRSNGLASMLRKMILFAKAYLSLAHQG